jgi:hypothetical protein
VKEKWTKGDRKVIKKDTCIWSFQLIRSEKNTVCGVYERWASDDSGFGTNGDGSRGGIRLMDWLLAATAK